MSRNAFANATRRCLRGVGAGAFASQGGTLPALPREGLIPGPTAPARVEAEPEAAHPRCRFRLAQGATRQFARMAKKAAPAHEAATAQR